MAKTKNKKKNLAEHISDKKKSKNAKTLNPFEMHINKEKIKVLGRKLKNDRGLPGVSRAKALKKRKGTLLQEFKLMNKSNKFIDKRIGEHNSGLSEDDRAMARYAAVRFKAHKKSSIFNLANDEVLTHKGQTLSEIEKFANTRSDDESNADEDTGRLESDFVEDAHFGGGVLTKTGNEGFKSHKDLINQLIAESKKRKAEKQKAKEQTLELTEKLDEEWKDLIPLVNNSFKRVAEVQADKSEVDDYDRIMKELKNQPRGYATDRLKTEDEIAREEKEKLEQLERERLSRMRGVFEDDKSEAPKHRSADDLDDNFAYDFEPEVTLSYNEKGESNVPVDKEMRVEVDGVEEEEEESEAVEEEEGDSEAVEEEEDGDAESEDDLSDLKEEDSSSDDEMNGDNEDSDRESSVTDNIKADLLVRKEMMEKAREELPYTFTLPNSYEELHELLHNKSAEHHCVILERMIKCNHPSLGEANKETLGLLFVYLLQYIDDLNLNSDIVNCFKISNFLVPQLFDLAQLNQENAQQAISEVIKEKQRDYRKNKKLFPSLNVLIFLKIVSCLFPTSDFRHPVVTPTIVFMDQMLHNCRIRSRRDIAYGLFLVTLVLEFTALSKRYLPSATKFLAGVLHMAIPKPCVKQIKVLPPFRSISSHLVLTKRTTTLTTTKLELTDLTELDISEDFKQRSLQVALQLVSEFNENFHELSSNCEIFSPIEEYLGQIPTANYTPDLRQLLGEILDKLKSNHDKKLYYIVMQASKPKALRLYEPNIQKVYDVKSRKIMSKEKMERAKLLHKIKVEKKGALREIRRDKAFLGRVKIKERIESDKLRKEKVKKIFAEANIQQSELNSMDRKNQRRRK
ncbi:hypothetical protein PPYR_11383 [Photinus pyralis]|uniref:Nucleolar protein 14 homolog n=1 Tax=Photinus pyralis TaxID=7054 RepID=A0A1Y1JZP6_PHOPY|nr:nucleolar protein 14 homolog [Photinus pyralis]KAB0794544.1 hypothetical protein PPYR_11383 [Photinus pyralis]